MANTLMNLLVSIGADISNFVEGLSQAEDESKGFGHRVGGAFQSISAGANAVAAVVTGVGAAAVSVGGAIGAMTVKAAKGADDLLVLSAKTGIATDQLQKMKYASELVDVPLETMTGSFARLTMSMDNAKSKTSEQSRIFSELGVSVMDAGGNLRNQNDVWLETIDALSKMENGAERDAMSLAIFGRSAMELNPLIKAGSAAISQFGAEAEAAGLILSEGELAKLGAVDDAMQRMKAATEGMTNNLAVLFAPAVEGVVSQVSGYMGQLTNIIGDSSLDAGGKIAAGSELIKNIASDIAAGLPGLIETGMGILQSLIEGIVGALPTLIPAVAQVFMTILNALIGMIPMLVSAGFQIIIQLALGIAQALPTLIPTIVQMLIQIVMIIVENIPLLIDAGLQILMGLVTGIIEALPILIAAIPTIITAVLEALLTALPMIIDMGFQILIALINGFIAAIPLILEMLPTLITTFVSMIPQIITALINALLTNIPMLIDAGIQLLLGLIDGLVTAIPMLIEMIPEIIIAIVSAIVEALPKILEAGGQILMSLINGIVALVSKLWEVGQQIVEGIKAGIEKAWDAVVKWFKDAFDKLIGGVKDFLGIKSPSKVFAGIGKNMALGLIGGYETDISNFTPNALVQRATVDIPKTNGSNLEQALSVALKQEDKPATARDIADALAYKLMSLGVVG